MAADAPATFDEVVVDHIDATYRLACAIVGDPDVASDVTQETFIAVWRGRGAVRDSARLGAWIHRITVNAAISALRRGRRDAERAERVNSQPQEHASAISTEELALREALWSLDPAYRLVLFLRFYEDLTVDEIARRTGLRSGTVKSRLHYGLVRLREAYESRETEGDR